jgi:hypothetical protein
VKKLVRAREISFLEGYHCQVTFDDGTKKVVDLKSFLNGPIFEPIRSDQAYFCSAQIADGVITWDNGADIDPDVLFYDIKPAWMEEPAAR